VRSAMRSTSLVVVILYAIEHFQCSSACFRISNTIMFPLRASGIALDWFPIIIFEPTVAIGYSDSVSGNRDQHFTSQPVNDRHGGIDCWISLYTSPILISLTLYPVGQTMSLDLVNMGPCLFQIYKYPTALLGLLQGNAPGL